MAWWQNYISQKIDILLMKLSHLQGEMGKGGDGGEEGKGGEGKGVEGMMGFWHQLVKNGLMVKKIFFIE